MQLILTMEHDRGQATVFKLNWTVDQIAFGGRRLGSPDSLPGNKRRKRVKKEARKDKEACGEEIWSLEIYLGNWRSTISIQYMRL